MAKITVTARPRPDHPGFGAAGVYFRCGEPTELDATAEQLAELTSEPASIFLTVEQATPHEKPKK